MKTFEKFVWDQVERIRPTSIVIDNLHARAIIQDRVDALRSEKLDILTTLVEIAATTQVCAEQLLLIRQQEESPKPDDLVQQLQHIAQYILEHSVNIQSKQRGTPRYSCEFDAEFLERLQDII